jgi:DnaK suppressor protein
MKTSHANTEAFQEILERKEAELARALRSLDDIAIEKSADQMDEIQHATERDMAIRNVDREANRLRDVKAALRRIHDGSFGSCISCDEAITSKRLAAVPWAPRCVQCQEAADRDRLDGTDVGSRTLVNAA